MGSYTKMQLSDGFQQRDEQVQEQYEDHFIFNYDLPRECAQHLFHSYGTNALRVVKLGDEHKLNVRVHEEYPFLKAEILYAVREEMAEKPNDILCRRVPVALLNRQLALDLLPEVVELMAKEKKWSSAQKKQELQEAIDNLQYMK